MNEFINIAAPVAAAVALGAAAFYILRKQSVNRIQSPEDDELFINIALCETRHGICTHYHDIGTAEMNYGGYPIHGHPTLCGAEVGWDMKNQDVDATCRVCVSALAKYAAEFDDNDASERKERNKLGMPG